MEYSIDGEDVSHSPRTQEKSQPNTQVLEKIEHESTDEKSKNLNELQNNHEESTGCSKILSIAFYQQFFQVSQQEVVDRIKMGFIPFKKEFIQKMRPNADFYGPFWILTTIIFLLGSTSNLSRYFYNWQKTQYLFRLELVRYAVVLVYTFGFGIPFVLYMILKFMKCTSITLPELICIYGYSFGCFVLVFLLCIIPAAWLHWLLMIYGMVNSTAFLILNLMEYLESMQKKSYLIFGIIGGAQIFLFLMFKLVFFDIIYDSLE